MFGPPSQRLLELTDPVVQTLVLPSVDQIEARSLESRRSGVERGPTFRGIVEPSQSPELVVSQRLDADRYPVDAGGSEAAEIFCVGRRRVGLQCHFMAFFKSPSRINPVQNPADSLRIHEARRSASEVDGDACPVACFLEIAVELPQIGIQPRAMIEIRRGVRIEVAIRAFGLAVRPMHIYPQRRRRRFTLQGRPP